MGSELKKAYHREALNPPYPYMPKTEWESRIKKARELMGKNGMDALIILNNQDRLYFFGSGKPYRYVYPNIGIIPREGPTAIISGSEDADVIAMEGYAHRNIGFRGDTMAPTPSAAEPVKLAAEVVEELGLANKTIGMEFGRFMWWEGFTMNEWERFKKELPKARFVDATDLIWDMRMIKSDWEIGIMRRLYQVTSKGYFQIIQNARPGVNERQLFYDALKIWIDEGIVESTNYLFSVINAVQPFRDRLLKEGDWILLDGGPMYKGYTADIQRIIHIGDPGKKAWEMGSLAARAQDAVEGFLKPGVTAGAIWQKGIGTVAEFAPETWHKARSRKFPSWVGHGEGLNLHEPPYLVENSDFVIKEGMTLAVEIPSFFGNRLANMPEDVFWITKDGCEKLTKDLGSNGIYVKT